MNLTPLQRQILIENTMTRMAMIGLGDYRSVYGVVGFLQRLLDMPKKNSVNIDNNFGSEMIQELSTAGFTSEDVETAEKKRSINRNLLKRITLRLLESSRDIQKAERIIRNALYDGNSKVLTAEELDELKAARILNVDTGWFFFPDSTLALQNILDFSNYSPVEAFVFLDSLTHPQKTNFFSLALQFHIRICADAEKLIQENIHPGEIIADYNRRAAGEAFVLSHIPELYDELFKPEIVPHFLSKLISSDIQQRYITYWLNLHWGNLAATVLTQPVAKAKSLLDNVYSWLQCRITPGKAEKPLEIDLAPAIPRVKPTSRFMDLLSDLYLEKYWGSPAMHYRMVDVDKHKPDFIHLYNDSPELQGELNNTILGPANISTVFTPEVQSELKVLITAKSIHTVMIEIHGFFQREIYSLPAAQGILLTQAFSQWVQCYVKNNCTAQIMTALWTEKNVPEIVPALAQNITAAAQNISTSVNNLALPVENRQDNSYQIYLAGVMGVLGISALTCMAARRFFKPSAANTQHYAPVSTEEPGPASKFA